MLTRGLGWRTWRRVGAAAAPQAVPMGNNYPVNDGAADVAVPAPARVHWPGLQGFAERGRRLTASNAARAADPVCRIPALTLFESYRLGEAYAYGEAFQSAAVAVLGEELALCLREDLLALNDVGLDRLGKREASLRERYSRLEHPGAREVVAWLNGAYRISDAEVDAQAAED